MRKYLLLTGAALVGLSGSAYAAIDCAVPPTCEELGYAYPSHWCENNVRLIRQKSFAANPKIPILLSPVRLVRFYTTTLNVITSPRPVKTPSVLSLIQQNDWLLHWTKNLH